MSWNYYTDKDVNIWDGRKQVEPRRLGWVAYKGSWQKTNEPEPDEGVGGTLQNRFAKPVPTTPEPPAPEASEPAPKAKARRRFGFSFPVRLAGVQGELTIEADTLKEAKDTLEEVKATAAKYKHLGIVVGVVPKPEDEYFILLADGTAFCRKYQAPMSKRMKQGDEWWSHNAGTESSPCYCRGRPGHDSPGWDK